MQLDDVIGQAQAVSTSVGEQGRIFDNIGSKLVSVSSKFPMVNGIMNGIRRKKNKVGADIECCLSDKEGSSYWTGSMCIAQVKVSMISIYELKSWCRTRSSWLV